MRNSFRTTLSVPKQTDLLQVAVGIVDDFSVVLDPAVQVHEVLELGHVCVVLCTACTGVEFGMGFLMTRSSKSV